MGVGTRRRMRGHVDLKGVFIVTVNRGIGKTGMGENASH